MKESVNGITATRGTTYRRTEGFSCILGLLQHHLWSGRLSAVALDSGRWPLPLLLSVGDAAAADGLGAAGVTDGERKIKVKHDVMGTDEVVNLQRHYLRRPRSCWEQLSTDGKGQKQNEPACSPWLVRQHMSVWPLPSLLCLNVSFSS